MRIKKIISWLIMINLIIIFLAVATGMVISFLPDKSYADVGTAPVAPAEVPDNVKMWGFLSAALATGIGSLGAGLAVSSVGSAAMGAISEKPELVGRALIFVGLAEGIAIYGLIISIMILGRI